MFYCFILYCKIQIIEENKPVEELPKLRKTSIASPKEEPKPEVAKPKSKAKPKQKAKYEELPEIPDYERPVLETYEKSEFTPTDFARELEIPNKMEKPILDSGKKEVDSPPQKNGIPKVHFPYFPIIFYLSLRYTYVYNIYVP